MTMDELCASLLITEGDCEFQEEYVPAPRGLVESCQGLVILESTSRLVKFTHFTVQEFLNSSDSLTLSRADIAKIYITCLGFYELVGGDSSHIKALLGETFEKNKFSRYAARNWADHIRGTAEESPDVQQAIVSLLASDSKRNSTVQWGTMRVGIFTASGRHFFTLLLARD
jgi:hypothetical protein